MKQEEREIVTALPIEIWFLLLPESLREAATEYARVSGRLEVVVISLHDALRKGFTWKGTKEGEEFWLEQYRTYGRQNLLPSPEMMDRALDISAQLTWEESLVQDEEALDKMCIEKFGVRWPYKTDVCNACGYQFHEHHQGTGDCP